jgi:hypothetical protein
MIDADELLETFPLVEHTEEAARRGLISGATA